MITILVRRRLGNEDYLFTPSRIVKCDICGSECWISEAMYNMLAYTNARVICERCIAKAKSLSI